MSSKRAIRRRVCDGKMKYAEADAARDAASRARRRARAVITAYRCAFCGQYRPRSRFRTCAAQADAAIAIWQMSASRTSTLTPEFGWNEVAGRYYDLSSGRFVANSTIRAGLDAALDASRRDVVAVTNALRNGEIPLATWQAAMETQIANAHLASASLAKGGWAHLTQADLRRVETEITRQYAYLRDWSNDIANGRAPRDGRMLTRATLYNDAARTTYEMTRQREMLLRGTTEMSRERHSTESCPSCIRYEAAGWQPVGSLPLPGQESECLTRCRCSVDYR
jgi:hypothetical protein